MFTVTLPSISFTIRRGRNAVGDRDREMERKRTRGIEKMETHREIE